MQIGSGAGKDGSAGNLPVPAQRLTEMRPMEIDKAMADWLPQSVTLGLRSKIHLGPDPGRIGEVTDWQVMGNIPIADAEAALSVLDELMVPADPNEALTELGKTRAVLAARKENEENQSIVLAVYVEMIEDEGYPIDVVVETCRDLRKLTKWWPTWSEFKERADREFLKRRALYKALRLIVAGVPNV